MPFKARRCLYSLLLAVLWASVAAARPLPNEIRVRLFERAAPQTLVVSAEHGLAFFAESDLKNARFTLGPQEEATIHLRGADVYVEAGDATFVVPSLHLVPRDNALLHVAVTEGHATSEPHPYPGRLDLAVDPTTPALKVVNQVSLSDYVACVVAREYGFDDFEGAKAMAVLARTYALRTAGTFGDDYDLVDHEMAQQYDGVVPLTETARQAVRATQGEVLTYKNELVEAVYFSSSGGHTADNDAVWNGKPVPYLRGIVDPYDAASPHARWETTFASDRLLHVLSERYGFDVEGFYIDDRSRDGRVQTIGLVHRNRIVREIPGNEFRMLVNNIFGKTHLKSTFFDIRHVGDQYVFDGRGFGHGVGLSQYGAREMSRRGFNYRAILSFYFRGVQVQQYRDLGNHPPVIRTAAPVVKVTAPYPLQRRTRW